MLKSGYGQYLLGLLERHDIQWRRAHPAVSTT